MDEVKPRSGRVVNPRSRWEIILDILEGISEEERERGKVKKTRIMQKALLDWRNFQRHFKFLIENDFVEEIDNPEESKGYTLTEKGKDLMRRLRDVEMILR